MKVDEFVAIYEKNAKEALDAINIKKYMSIGQKYLTAKAIVDAVTSKDENGVVKVDSYQLEMVTFYRIYTEYTDLEIEPEDIITAYDKLYMCDAMDEIDEILDRESIEINRLGRMYLRDLMNYENSPAKILGEGVSAILSSLNSTSESLIGTVTDAIDNVDIGKVIGALIKK